MDDINYIDDFEDSMDKNTSEKLINSFLSRENINARLFYMDAKNCFDIIDILSIKRLGQPEELTEEFSKKVKEYDNVYIFNVSRMNWLNYFSRSETIWIKSEPLQVTLVKENSETIEGVMHFAALSGENGFFGEVGIYSDEEGITWFPIGHSGRGQLTKGVR